MQRRYQPIKMAYLLSLYFELEYFCSLYFERE